MNSAEIEMKNVHRLLEAPVDGAILVPSTDRPQGYGMLREKGMHVVLADRTPSEHGVTVRAPLVMECSFDAETSHAAMTRILKAGQPLFTAAFAGSDLIAFGIRKAMEERGLNTPRDVSLVGYGDMPISALISLTSVSCPAFEMGKSALTLLMHMVEHKFISSRRVILRPTLVLRSSCRQMNGA